MIMKCYLCNAIISGRYYRDGHGNCICASHYEQKEAVQCFSCGAFTYNSPEFTLLDGRHLCPVCMAQGVNSVEQIQRIKKQILYFFANEDIFFHNRTLDDVSINIVGVTEIARMRNSSISLANKGVTITKSMASLIGMALGQKSKMTHSVYILDHLIKIEFAATLAHEFMHIWQNENGVKLEPKKCEGLCNLGAWLIYNKITSANTPYLLKSLMENPDPIYGDGFRYVYNRYQELGTEGILNLAIKGNL